MIHILLMILKIAGIVLLSLIGIILLLACCILFVPIRYSGRMVLKEKAIIDFKASYLCKILYFHYHKEGKSNVSFRIFGFQTGFFNKEKRQKKKKKMEQYEEETEMFERMSEEINQSNDNISLGSKAEEEYEEYTSIVEVRDEEAKKIIRENNKDNDKQSELESEVEKTDCEDKRENNTTDDESEEDLWFFSKYIRKIKEKFRKIKFRFKRFYDTIKKVQNKKRFFLDLLADESIKESYYYVKMLIFKVLRHVRPRKVKGYLHFGFDDPSYTGKLLGLFCIFYGNTHNRVEIIPDFEHEILEGDLYLKGRVQIYVLLIAAYRLYKNENIKKVMERRRTYGRKQ